MTGEPAPPASGPRVACPTRCGGRTSRSPPPARTRSPGGSSSATSSSPPAGSPPATSASPLWSSLRSINEGEPQPIVALDQVPEGTAHLFDYPGGADPAILVHFPGGELRAFSQKCTHLGCVVYYQPDRGEMECPCHEGRFDAATGDVLAGPPQRPLGPHRRRGPRRDRVGAAGSDAGRGRGVPSDRTRRSTPAHPAPRPAVRGARRARLFVVVLLSLQVFLLTVGARRPARRRRRPRLDRRVGCRSLTSPPVVAAPLPAR